MNQTRLPPSVQRARTFLRPRPEASGGLFDWARVAGRVVEVSEEAAWGALSALCGLLLQVQARLESIAWIETGDSLFFPPDLAFRGIDVEAITVVLASEPQSGLQAADGLVRSGAFGLVVVDWAGGGIDEAVAGRLARMAETGQTAVLFLTRKKAGDPSLATQISVRGVVSQTPGGETRWQVVRDKRSGPLSDQKGAFDGPFGLY